MMSRSYSLHTWAVLQALFVTFLWSTSWVFIKFGLADIPATPAEIRTQAYQQVVESYNFVDNFQTTLRWFWPT